MSEPGKPVEEGEEPSTGQDDPHALMDEVASALRQGRAPRAGRYLQIAARNLTESGDTEGAARALRLVAMLELRRGKPQQALRPARAAERLLRESGPTEEHSAVLDLVSRVYSILADHAQAVRIAERWSGLAAGAADEAAVRRLSLGKWASGDVSGAIERLADPDQEVETASTARAILQAQMLIRVGCPTEALAAVSRLLKRELASEEECEALLARGWAALCLAQPDLALRSFRRAARIADGLASPRTEAEVAAALATGELERAKQRGVETARLEARLARRIAQAGRLGLHHLAEAGGPEEGVLAAGTAKEAAQRLVALTRTSECLALVDACCLEVERLSGLLAGAPPFGFSQVPPLSLE